MTITKTSVEECALVPEFYLGNAIIRCSMKDKYIGECLKFSIRRRDIEVPPWQSIG
jgi:hypothetical protein